MKKKKTNTIKFQKNFQFNIGIVIIIIIFIYVLFHVFSFLTDKDIKVYEVTEGSINSSMQKNALALRQEEVFTAPANGQINYYKQNASKVGVKSPLYSIDSTGEITNKINSTKTDMSNVSSGMLSDIYDEFNVFLNGYSNSDFNKTAMFKTNLNTNLASINTNIAMNTLASDIEAARASGEFQLNYAPKAGLFMLTIDGFENYNIDNFTKDSFDIDKLNKINLANNTNVTEGTTIYKLITSDKWYLVFPINDNEEELLREEEYINVQFKQDDLNTYGASKIVEQNSKKYLTLEFDDAMERYADNRFMTIELLLNNKSGLKIPNSAITEKEFFVIPKNYFLKGDDSNSEGVMLSNSDGNEFISPTVYYETEDAYYIDNELLDAKDYIIKPNSTEKYRVDTQTDSLKGVYNVNKGYAVFKQIKILNQNKEYSIVDKNTSYGIALYDRIALDGSEVKENDLI